MNVFDKHSANSTIIAFEYQFYYLLKIMLSMQSGDVISFELVDDVAIETKNGRSFYQLKHSIGKNAKNTYLSNKDIDLFKTLAMWLEFDNEENIMDNSEFFFVTNKLFEYNEFVSLICKNKNNSNYYKEIKALLYKYIKETKNEELKEYLSYIVKYNSSKLKSFFKKITFVDQESDIISEIKEQLIQLHIDKKNVDSIYNDYFSEFKTRYYKDVKEIGKFEVTYQKLHNVLVNIFSKYRTTGLIIRKYEDKLPDDLLSQNFIRELIEIGDISENSKEISEYTIHKISVINNINSFLKDGVLTYDDVKKFEDEAFLVWKNEHKNAHRRQIDDNRAACDCLYSIKNIVLTLNENRFERWFSNGEFYCLSDEEKIGWKKKWEDKYK